MRHFLFYQFMAICALFVLSSCEHDDPVNPIKPREDRTVLVLSSDGKIYDQTGQLVKELPNCTFASEIIADGDDYFYLLDIPNVLKNSGIFPLEDFHDFIPADHALRVTEGKCYVIGYEFSKEDAQYVPTLYTNRNKDTFKKEYLPMPIGAKTGECQAIYAYDRDHTVIGGSIDRLPAVWVDKQCQVYEISHPELLDEGSYLIGRIDAITMCNGHIYAAGFEHDENENLISTVWIDGIPHHYLYDPDNDSFSQAIEVYSYGGDVYMLTSEFDNESGKVATFLWINGMVVMSYPGIEASGLTVL